LARAPNGVPVARGAAGHNGFLLLFACPAWPPWYQASRGTPPLDLNEVIREVNRLMADEVAARSVGIETDLADDLPPIWADRVQMQQVIANLARNGIEAMESEDSDPKMLSIRSRRDGTNSVLIEIRDEGSGLEDLERVFEPFFTTKETGMGMGLAISRWIVEAHQGRLWATSNTTRGAVFSFTLPIASSAS